MKAHQCKAGTPTMGGLLIVFAVSVSVLLWADLTNAYVWMTMLVFIGFSAVGFIDDFMKEMCIRDRPRAVRNSK